MLNWRNKYILLSRKNSGNEYILYHILLRALDGWKQSSRAWDTMLSSSPISLHFQPVSAHHILYVCTYNAAVILILVYVDDIQISRNDEIKLNETIDEMETQLAVGVEPTCHKLPGMSPAETEIYICLHHASLFDAC